MTFDEWVNNPSGGRVGGLEREAYKSTMTNRLDPVLVRENNDIKYECYIGGKDTYWLRVKVPSEVIKDFTYDVVIKFTKPKTAITMGSSLLNTSYQFQVFSNDPAFNYTHVYVYKKNGLLIKELEPKCNKVALKTPPRETNVHEIVTYCKSIYWAYLIAKHKGLFTIENYTKKLNINNLLNDIEHSDVHIQRRQELQEKENAGKRKERKREETAAHQRMSDKPKGPNFAKGLLPNFNKGKEVNFKIPSRGRSNKK